MQPTSLVVGIDVSKDRCCVGFVCRTGATSEKSETGETIGSLGRSALGRYRHEREYTGMVIAFSGQPGLCSTLSIFRATSGRITFSPHCVQTPTGTPSIRHSRPSHHTSLWMSCSSTLPPQKKQSEYTRVMAFPCLAVWFLGPSTWAHQEYTP